MKRLVVALLALFISVGAFAQTIPNFSTYGTAFQNFASDIANSLPLNASIGSDWSDGYIGYLPHFGIGITAGASTIPKAAVDNLLTTLGVGTTATLFPSGTSSVIDKYGIPFPAYAVNARIGGLFLPFDIGLKFGYLGDKLPAVQNALPAGMNLNYLLMGMDVKYRLIKEGFIIPEISVGAGFNYLSGNVTLPTSSSDISVGSFTFKDQNNTSHTYDVKFTNPNLNFNWNTKAIDLKVMASKHILIFTPYLGLAASKGFSSAGGGVSSQMLISTDGGSTYHTPSPTELQYLNYGLQSVGAGSFDATSTSVLVAAAASGWSFRTFGGVSLDLLILHLDLQGMYDFLGKNYGASVNLRVQF